MKDAQKEVYELLLSYRGLEPDDVCRACSGFGRRSYGSTSTWRGGIGGQMLTADVCNKCWGTGSKTRKGADLKKIGSEMAALKRQVKDMRQIVDNCTCWQNDCQ